METLGKECNDISEETLKQATTNLEKNPENSLWLEHGHNKEGI